MPYTVQFVNAHPLPFLPRVEYLQLTWTDSTDPNAASVNIYRATVSGGPYTLIQTGIPMGVQLYLDETALPNTFYYYVVTEVNNAAAESGFSTEQSGIIR